MYLSIYISDIIIFYMFKRLIVMQLDRIGLCRYFQIFKLIKSKFLKFMAGYFKILKGGGRFFRTSLHTYYLEYTFNFPALPRIHF